MTGEINKKDLSPKQIQKVYAAAIKSLFGGRVHVAPYQINKEVIDLVDTMLKEICQCSEPVKDLAFELLYGRVLGWLPSINPVSRYTVKKFPELEDAIFGDLLIEFIEKKAE